MFVQDGDLTTEISNPDPQAGLWARTRNHKEMRVVYPRNCLAFQIGETAQIFTGGVLRATPHAVQAPRWCGSSTSRCVHSDAHTAQAVHNTPSLTHRGAFRQAREREDGPQHVRGVHGAQL